MIEEILEDTMSIKKMKNNLRLGHKWMSYIIVKGSKIYERKTINRTVTRFYTELYDDNNYKDTPRASEVIVKKKEEYKVEPDS